jgi:hypothetical protein
MVEVVCCSQWQEDGIQVSVYVEGVLTLRRQERDEQRMNAPVRVERAKEVGDVSGKGGMWMQTECSR